MRRYNTPPNPGSPSRPQKIHPSRFGQSRRGSRQTGRNGRRWSDPKSVPDTISLLTPIRKKGQSRIDIPPLRELPRREISVAPYRCPEAPAALCLQRRFLGFSAEHSASAVFWIGANSLILVGHASTSWVTPVVRKLVRQVGSENAKRGRQRLGPPRGRWVISRKGCSAEAKTENPAGPLSRIRYCVLGRGESPRTLRG